jgi:PPOX class probable F420-dependent enzyme
MAELTDAARQLLEEPNLAHVVTLMRDGSPQVTVVWVDCDGENVLINTAEGRQKPRNLRRDARVAVSVVDRNDPYRTLQVRGRVVAMEKGEAAWAHIDKLSKKYTGREDYPRREGEERIIVKIAPEHVTVRGR